MSKLLKKITFTFSLTAIIFVSFAQHLVSPQAKEIELFLNKLRQSQAGQSPFLKEKSFTENDFNLYLQQIYIKNETPEVKEIKIDFTGKNSIFARLRIELDAVRYPKLPANLLKTTVEIASKIESNNGKMRLKPESIIINKISFSPQLLDQTLELAQSGKEKKSSIYDWFKLLPGIKKIEIDKGKITFYY